MSYTTTVFEANPRTIADRDNEYLSKREWPSCLGIFMPSLHSLSLVVSDDNARRVSTVPSLP
jgi:hypothetical protein